MSRYEMYCQPSADGIIDFMRAQIQQHVQQHHVLFQSTNGFRMPEWEQDIASQRQQQAQSPARCPEWPASPQHQSDGFRRCVWDPAGRWRASPRAVNNPSAWHSNSCPQPAWAEECASQTSGRAEAPLAELISSSSSTEGDNAGRRGGSLEASEAAARHDQQWNSEGSRSSIDSIEVAADGAAVPAADSEAGRRGQGAANWQQDDDAHQDAFRGAESQLRLDPVADRDFADLAAAEEAATAAVSHLLHGSSAVGKPAWGEHDSSTEQPQAPGLAALGVEAARSAAGRRPTVTAAGRAPESACERPALPPSGTRAPHHPGNSIFRTGQDAAAATADADTWLSSSSCGSSSYQQDISTPQAVNMAEAEAADAAAVDPGAWLSSSSCTSSCAGSLEAEPAECAAADAKSWHSSSCDSSICQYESNPALHAAAAAQSPRPMSAAVAALPPQPGSVPHDGRLCSSHLEALAGTKSPNLAEAQADETKSWLGLGTDSDEATSRQQPADEAESWPGLGSSSEDARSQASSDVSTIAALEMEGLWPQSSAEEQAASQEPQSGGQEPAGSPRQLPEQPTPFSLLWQRSGDDIHLSFNGWLPEERGGTVEGRAPRGGRSHLDRVWSIPEELEPSDAEPPSQGQAGGFETVRLAPAVQFWQDFGSSGAAQQGRQHCTSGDEPLAGVSASQLARDLACLIRQVQPASAQEAAALEALAQGIAEEDATAVRTLAAILSDPGELATSGKQQQQQAGLQEESGMQAALSLVDAMAEACEQNQQPRRPHTRSQSMGSLSLGGSTAQALRLQGSGGSGPLLGVRGERALALSASQTIRGADAEFQALLARQQGRRSSWQQAKDAQADRPQHDPQLQQALHRFQLDRAGRITKADSSQAAPPELPPISPRARQAASAEVSLEQQRRMLAHKIQMQILAHRLERRRSGSPIQGKGVLPGHKSQGEPVESSCGAVQAPGNSCTPRKHKRAASGRRASRSAASESSTPRAVRSASVPCLGRSLSALLSREVPAVAGGGSEAARRSAPPGGGTSSARDAPAVPGRGSLDTCSSLTVGTTVVAVGSSGGPGRHSLDSHSLPASSGRGKPSGLLGPLRRSLSPLRSLSPFRRRGSRDSGQSRRRSASSDDEGLLEPVPLGMEDNMPAHRSMRLRIMQQSTRGG